ncbi:N-myc-interactor-like [Rhincodon typus]|uniref:N-myc-interactor-like n=1 Tax=Rhincodon typus TaxID=259920 RepID=UPI002030D849|nr:N-myc-interactor-like [Rhincodon typus]XP_048455126.1 N-myc-interactor-like [Rhincodon typus]XP_048455127.1 N-myc-interactor-like [Rhincodon typus]XP_048455128.1 N-myc-interactor-like [Rhincodon typus]
MEQDGKHLAAEFSNSHADFEIIQESIQDNMSLYKTLQQAEQELELWQSKIDNLERRKSDLICAKLDAEEKKKQISHKLCKLNNEHEKLQGEIQRTGQSLKEKLCEKEAEREKLKERLIELEKELRITREDCSLLHSKFKIKATLPEKNIRFTKLEESVPTAQEGEDFLKIKCCYVVSPEVSLALQNGQALITFENEQVASKILRVAKHHINLDPGKLDVKIHPVKLGTARKFEVHVDISRKTVKVSQIPEILPEEQMRDKLEISFSKPSLGGGEVEHINYDRFSGTAVVTFVEKGSK